MATICEPDSRIHVCTSTRWRERPKSAIKGVDRDIKKFDHGARLGPVKMGSMAKLSALDLQDEVASLKAQISELEQALAERGWQR